jgi:glycerol uptake facilitator-like aquaporin
VSGANFNPAVTLALCLLNKIEAPLGLYKIEAPLGLLYVAVQILAGIVATFSFTLLYTNGKEGRQRA